MPPSLRPIAVAFVALGSFLGTWAVVAADVEHALGASHGAFGLLLAVAVLGSAGVGAITGTLVERWGVAPVLTAGSAWFAAMVALLALAGGSRSTVLIAGLVIAVFSSTGLIDVAMNVAATAVLVDEPGRLVRFHAFYNLGAASGAAITALVVHLTHEWRAALVVPAVVIAVSTVVVSRSHVPVGESGEHQGMLHAMRTVRSEGLILLGFVFALSAMVEGGIDTWGVLALRDLLAVGIVVGALAQAIGQGVAALGRATLGPAAGSLGTVRGVAIGAGLAAGGLVLLAVAPAPLAVAGLVLAAAGVAVCWPMLLAHASQGVAGPAGVVGGVTAIGYLGFVIGPAVIGLLASVAGLRSALLVIALASAVVAVTPRWLRPAR